MSDGSHSIRAMAVVNTPVIATVTGEEKGRRFEKRIKKKGQRTVSNLCPDRGNTRTCVQRV